MVAAIAPLTAPHATSQVTRAIHRTLGTAGGLVTAGLLLSLHLPPWALVVAVAVLQIGAELWVGRNYAIAMLMVTPLALAMGQLGGPSPVAEVLAARGLETLIGCVVGVAIALLSHWLRGRRTARRKAREAAAREASGR